MSTSTEVIPVPDIIFKGTDGNECESFVVAIRDFAFAIGREKDRHWLLYFATTRLRGKALRWHARLDTSIKDDWELFIQALFDRYPFVEEPGHVEMVTPLWSATTFSPGSSTITLPSNPEADQNLTGQKFATPPTEQAGHEEPNNPCTQDERPHASLTRQYDASCTGQQIGLLRIVGAEGATVPQYVWWDYSDRTNYAYFHRAMTTTNRHEALVVSFLPSSEPHKIGCMNSAARFKTLALQWCHSSSGPEYFALYTFSNEHGVITPAAKTSGYIGTTWNVLADGTLQASLSSFSQKLGQTEYGETKFKTTEVHVDTSGDIIRFVKPGALLEQDKPQGSPIHPFARVRIVFEPL